MFKAVRANEYHATKLNLRIIAKNPLPNNASKLDNVRLWQ